jgi:hypothetical protein
MLVKFINGSETGDCFSLQRPSIGKGILPVCAGILDLDTKVFCPVLAQDRAMRVFSKCSRGDFYGEEQEKCSAMQSRV